MTATRRKRNRKGTVLVLTAFMMIVMMGLLALAVDVGYLMVVDSELQRSADAAALSGAWELMDETLITGEADPYGAINDARNTAAQFAALNQVTSQAVTLAQQDTVIGHLAMPSDPNDQMNFCDPTRFNAVTVCVRKSQDQNGEVPLLFARCLGYDRIPMSAQATAAFVSNFRGFQTPSDGSNLEILPFALDEDTCVDLLGGNRSTCSDDWRWNTELEEVQRGCDEVLEVNLFPQGTGSPGNRGTVDIGSRNNSTCDIARQISSGISPEDMEYHGGRLEFDENGEMFLNGDTGISAGVKDELESIKGQPRIIPIFRDVSGPGNNATYTIVTFLGIRIMDVKLTGPMCKKRVTIQPANVQTQGGIPDDGEPKSHFVYSPVWLVR